MDVEQVYPTMMTTVAQYLIEANVSAIHNLRQDAVFLSILQTKGIVATEGVAKLLDKTDHYNSAAVVRCYEELFEIIVEFVPDKLYLFITLLEQLDEDTCCVEKFLVLLYPIQLSLLRAPPSCRVQWLEWVLTTVESYIGKMALPEDYEIESDEKKMLLSHPYVDIVLRSARRFCSFYDALVSSSLWSADNNSLAAFGFHILSGPLMHLYVEKFPEAMQIAKSIVSLIDRHSCNVYRLFDWLDESRMSNFLFKTTEIPENNDVYRPPKLNERVTVIQLALYYCVKTSNEETFAVFPRVYERLYVLHKVLFLSVRLLQYAHNAVVRQGLKLADRFLNAVEDNSIPHQHLEMKVHFDFVQSMSRLSTLTYIYENRQLAFTLLKVYLNKFTPLATYLLYSHVFEATENPDVDGEIVSYFRHKLFRCFSAGQLDEFHSGKRLVDLLRCFCRLEKGEKTDLIKHKSVILSTLHTFVLILGRDTKNETGVCDHFRYFEEHYFEVLKSAMELTRKEFHTEIEELLGTQSNPSCLEDKLNLVVEGEELPPPKTQEKVESLRRDLRVIDLIQDALDMVYTYARK
ncbi:hypothetical protein V9T40_002036 [Parthenolecanium corni]|uniref:Glomulin n=1 Tax=Parthenolecanium corni TaxID=536013 RepID=A0AAN9TK20_9HEMI